MSEQYRVAQGMLKLPGKREFIRQGEAVPEMIFSQPQLESLARDGIVELIPAQLSADEKKRLEHRGPWRMNPASLVGKDMEAMLLMVHEIDPNVDLALLQTEQMVVALLTKDWDPSIADELATSNDSTAPALNSKGVKDLGNVPMAESAKTALERAREKAQG